MELTVQDRYELVKAAVRCTDPGVREWLVQLSEQGEDGKRNFICPSYPSANGHRNGNGQSPDQVE
jgi:hypothetical protein